MSTKEEHTELKDDLKRILSSMIQPGLYSKSIMDLTDIALNKARDTGEMVLYTQLLGDTYVSSICVVLTTHAKMCTKPECMTHT
ncbi:MAG: hypothetical protein V3S69_05950, partial [Dehalococcoidales bacterium]